MIIHIIGTLPIFIFFMLYLLAHAFRKKIKIKQMLLAHALMWSFHMLMLIKRKQASTCKNNCYKNNNCYKKYMTANWYSIISHSNSFEYWAKATWMARRKKAKKKHEQPMKFRLKTINNWENRTSGSLKFFFSFTCFFFFFASSVVIHFSSQLSPKPKPLLLSCIRQEQTPTPLNEYYSFFYYF